MPQRNYFAIPSQPVCTCDSCVARRDKVFDPEKQGKPESWLEKAIREKAAKATARPPRRTRIWQPKQPLAVSFGMAAMDRSGEEALFSGTPERDRFVTHANVVHELRNHLDYDFPAASHEAADWAMRVHHENWTPLMRSVRGQGPPALVSDMYAHGGPSMRPGLPRAPFLSTWQSSRSTGALPSARGTRTSRSPTCCSPKARSTGTASSWMSRSTRSLPLEVRATSA
mmetsp:Transcript_43643/g.120788  ORF Transcript_43643/g.120788 Transcript_43643/m.120788 type:complete len:227 (+) Transcript_43643:96-776(+)